MMSSGKILRKRVTAVFLLLLAAAGFLYWWNVGVPVVEKEMQSRLQSLLTRTLGRPVHIGRVVLHPFLINLSFQDILVETPAPANGMGPQAAPIFQCDRILIQLTPHRLRITRPWFAFVLGNVIIDKPEVHLSLDSLSGHSPAKNKAFAFPLLLLQAEWRDGKLDFTFRNDRPPLQVDQWSGRFILTKPGISLETAARAANGPFKAMCRVKNWKTWEADVRQEKASLAELAANSPIALPGKLDGRADAELRLSGVWPPNPSKVRWRLSGSVREGSWLFPDAADAVPFSGRFSWQPDHLRLKDMRVANGVVIAGHYDRSPKAGASLDFTFRADGLNLSDTRRMVPSTSFASEIPLDGTASFDGHLTGTISDPVLTLKTNVRDPKLSFIAFPEMEATLNATRRDVQADVSTLEGNISISGQRDDESNAWKWDVRSRHLSLREWSEINHWGNIGGSMNAHFSMSGVPPNAAAEGRVEIDKVTWGVHEDTGTLAMRMDFSNDRLELRGEGRALHVDLHRDGDDWVLSQLDFNLPDGLSLSGQGKWERDTGRLDGSVSLQNFSLRDVPVFLKSYPDIQGQFDFDGKLSGVMGAPVFTGNSHVTGLNLRPGGLVQDGSASLEWRRKQISFSQVQLGDSLRGKGAWSQTEGWHVEADIDGMNAGFVAEVINSTGAFSGQWDGHLTASGKAHGLPQAEGDLIWRDGVWKKFSFQSAEAGFHAAGGQLDLDHFEIRQASGSCTAQGKIPLLSSGGPLDVALHFQQVSFGVVSLDGELDLAGQWEAPQKAFSGRVRSPSFWINGVGLGASQASLNVNRSRVKLSELSALEGALRGDADVNLTEKTLSAQLDAKSVDLRAAVARWHSTTTAISSGTLSGRMTLDGPWDDLQGGLHLNWDHVRLNGVPFGGSLDGQWSAPRLKISSLKLNLPAGGCASGQAEFVFTPASSTVQGEMNFADVPLDETLRAVSVPSLLSGKWNGNLSWEGDLRNPIVNASVSGKDAKWKDSLFPSWDARFRFQNRQMEVQEFQAKTAEGLWRVNAGSRIFFTRAGEGHLQLVQDIRNIHLGPLSLFGGLEIVGTWRSGPVASFEADLRAQSLWVNQHFFNQDLAHLVWSQKKLVFSPLSGSLQAIAGTVDLDRLPQVQLHDVTLSEQGQRRLWMNGEVGPNFWNFELQGWNLEAGTLISLADLDVPVSGQLNARVTGHGNPEKPNVEGVVSGKDGHIGFVPYDHLSAAIQWNGPFIEIQNLEATRKAGYSVKGSGRIPVTDDEKLSNQMSVVMRLTNGDLHIVKDIWPNIRAAEGSFQGELQLFSGEDSVRMAGFLTVENGQLSATHYFHKITDLNARLLLQDDKLTVENISGRVGRGRLAVQGKIGLKEMAFADYDLSIQSVGSHGIDIDVPQLSVPPGPLLKRFSLLRESLQDVSHGEPRVYLKVEGTADEPQVRGTFVLDNTQFTYPPADKKSMESSIPAVRDFMHDAWWDIEFRASDNTWYRNEFVNVQMNGAVKIVGKRGDLSVNGRMTTQRGVISYLGQNFNVKDAMFEIVADTRTITTEKTVIPYLSGTAEKEMVTIDDRGVPTPDTIVMVVRRAPLGEIQPQFISRNRPALSSERVAQMALGLRSEDTTNPLTTTPNPQLQDQILRSALVQLVGSTAGPLASRIANRFGIDMITPIYEPQETDTTDPNIGASSQIQQQQRKSAGNYLQGTGVSAGMQLSNRIFGAYKVTYDQALTQQNQYYFHDELELTYRVKGNLHLRASTELDTQRLLGQPPDRRAVLENQWRFGPPKPLQKQTTSQEKDESKTPHTAP